MRVLKTKSAMNSGYYACAQYSADVLRFGRSWSFNDGSVENTNVFLYNAYSDSPYVMVQGTWNTQTATIMSSDRNLKSDIETLDERYDLLFDSISPCRFKFKDGSSGRYHTGFIAQEIAEALKSANIPEKEFAGICTLTPNNGEQYSGLRYEEFIALNTMQIQKLKARIDELERKLTNGEAVGA